MLPGVHYHAVRDPKNPELFINVHSHGYRQMGFPEFCYIADAASVENDNDTNEILNAVHNLYDEAYSYGIPLDVSRTHVFDDSKMSDGKRLRMMFIPVICYDEECLMFIRLDTAYEDRVIYNYQKFSCRDRWQGIEMNGKWLFERKYAPVVFNEQLMKERILRYLSEV